MYCVKCGAKQPEGAVFCSSCGGTVFSDTVPPSLNTAAPDRPVRNTAIPLKRIIPAEEPVRKDTSAKTDRSIPIMRPAVPDQEKTDKKPEKKAAPVSQRAIAKPAQTHRVNAGPRPFFYQPPEIRAVSSEAQSGIIPAADENKTPKFYDTDTLMTDTPSVPEEIISQEAATVTEVSPEVSAAVKEPDVIRTEEAPAMPEETDAVPVEEPAVPKITETEETSSEVPEFSEPQQAEEPADVIPETDTAEEEPEKVISVPSEEPVYAAEGDTAEEAPEGPDTVSDVSADAAESPAAHEEKPAAKTDSSTKGTPGKKGYLAAAAAVIILLAGLWYAFRIWPQKQFEKFYSAGSQALEQFDYEKAAENLALAYKIKQDDPSLNEMLYMAYQGVYDQKLQDGDLEAAIAAGSGMVGLIPENDEDIKKSLGRLYISYVRTLLLDGRTEKASKAAAAAEQYINEEDLGSLKAIQESFSKLSTFAEKVAEMADGGQHRDICTMIDEIKPDIIACSDTSTGRQPVVRVKDRSHQYVVFYRHSSGQYYVFYGDLTDEGKRTGTGSIYYDGRSTSKDMLYYYTSGWENDKPNGEFSEHEFTGSRYGTETMYEGMLKDGFFDGRIAITWGSSGVYYGEYSSGKVKVLEIDEETGRYIIAYNEAHDDYLSFPNDPSSSRFGVDFY